MDGTRKLNMQSLDSDVPEQRSARAERRICSRPALRTRVLCYANVKDKSAALDENTQTLAHRKRLTISLLRS